MTDWPEAGVGKPWTPGWVVGVGARVAPLDAGAAAVVAVAADAAAGAAAGVFAGLAVGAQAARNAPAAR